MALKPCAYIPSATTKQTLAVPLDNLVSGKHQPEPFKSQAAKAGAPIVILVDKDIPKGANKVETHRHEADIFMAIDGETYFEVGGEVVAPWARQAADGSVNDLEIRAKEIKGGTVYKLTAGDILYIPPGQPHVHWNTTGGASRLWVIKIPTREIVPIEEIPGWGS